MSDHEAGRELDALVAEEVMGWSYQAFPHGVCPDVKHWSPPGGTARMLPAYSTDIAAAWAVAWQVAPPGCMFRLLRNRDKDEWECIVEYDHVGRAPTAAHAICLAALATMEVRDD